MTCRLRRVGMVVWWMLAALVVPATTFAGVSNQPPTITSTAPATATEDVTYTYDAIRSDLDGPGQTWSLTGSHTCGGSIDASSGQFSFTPVGPAPPASCVVSVQICDGGSPDLCDAQTTPVTIAAVNDAPVLDAAKTPVLAAVDEDAGVPAGSVGTPVLSLVDFAAPAGQVDNVSDGDANAVLGIALTAANTAIGTWFYSLDDGSSWLALGAVSDTSARLLAADAGTRIYFRPNANFSGIVSNAITFRVWDRTSGSNGDLASSTPAGGGSAFSTATDTASITVIGSNDAPVLDVSRTPVMNPIAEDAGVPVGAVGALVLNLVDSMPPAGGLDNVTDVDAGAAFGVAVTAADTTSGTWLYSIDGGSSWNALGAVSDTSARLLAANGATRLYFQPTPDFSGTIANAITFRAWDQTSGSNGDLASSTPGGGSSAFSTATDTASITVIASNDAPVLDAARSPLLNAVGVDAGAPAGAVGTLVANLIDFAVPSGQLDNVVDPDGNVLLGIALIDANTTSGTWFYSIDGGSSWLALGAVTDTNARLLAADASTRIYFEPNPGFEGTIAAAIAFRAWDQTSGSNGDLTSSTPAGGGSGGIL